MESDKSRVAKYAQLRKQIAMMDEYTFEPAKKEEPKVSLSMKEEILKEDEPDVIPGIKRNTLSVSLDQIISNQSSQDLKEKEKQTRNAYLKKQHDEKIKKIKKIVLWSAVVVLIALILMICLVLLFK